MQRYQNSLNFNVFNGLFRIWEKNDFRPKLGKIWNVDYFDIVAPPLTLAKTVIKSYQTDIWGLFYSYIGHICTKCCIYLTNISPIYHKNYETYNNERKKQVIASFDKLQIERIRKQVIYSKWRIASDMYQLLNIFLVFIYTEFVFYCIKIRPEIAFHQESNLISIISSILDLLID